MWIYNAEIIVVVGVIIVAGFIIIVAAVSSNLEKNAKISRIIQYDLKIRHTYHSIDEFFILEC